MQRLMSFLAVAGAAAGLVYFLQTRRRAADAHGRARGYYEGEPVPDDILEARIRSALAPVAPREAIDLRVTNGAVVLRGALARAARDRVLAAVLAVPGVTQVANYLETQPAQEAPAAF